MASEQCDVQLISIYSRRIVKHRPFLQVIVKIWDPKQERVVNIPDEIVYQRLRRRSRCRALLRSADEGSQQQSIRMEPPNRSRYFIVEYGTSVHAECTQHYNFFGSNAFLISVKLLDLNLQVIIVFRCLEFGATEWQQAISRRRVCHKIGDGILCFVDMNSCNSYI